MHEKDPLLLLQKKIIVIRRSLELSGFFFNPFLLHQTKGRTATYYFYCVCFHVLFFTVGKKTKI